MATKQRRPRRDKEAAELIRKLMVREGHSPESLSLAIVANGIRHGFPRNRVHVSHDILRLMFSTGHEPGPRIKFAVALYFGLEPGQIWARDAFDSPVPQRVAA